MNNNPKPIKVCCSLALTPVVAAKFRESYNSSQNIPSEDPYEEAARQLLEQAPCSPEYVPDPMELEDHVPVYIPEPEHPEDLVPAEDEAPTPPLPPFFLSLRFRDTEGDDDRLIDGPMSGQLPAVRAEIEVLRRKRLAYEQESIQTRQDLARLDFGCSASSCVPSASAFKAGGTSVDTLEDTEPQGQHQSHPTLNATPTTTVTEAQTICALNYQWSCCCNGESRSKQVKLWDFKVSEGVDGAHCDGLRQWSPVTTTPEAAHAMPWATLKKMMTDKYCPRERKKYDDLSKNNQNQQNKRQNVQHRHGSSHPSTQL
ncbi:hypothetical protein Tco_0873702 [Tanacetum coccineum]|uniref:Uncharacterized protein n=1 Tax=Tanacetum coccineum TaxID=301880 RepID=A0ABQ5BJY5_9ASTR